MADSLSEALQALEQIEVESEPYGSALVIDNDLRTINVPSNFIFGVYNDKNVLSVDFEMPRYYDDIDLSSFTIQINYMTASDVGNVYQVENPVIGDTSITFEWLLDRGVFLSSGDVRFIVCLRELGENGAVIREFNTTVARGAVLEGLEIEDPEDPEAYSILAHLQQIETRVANRASTVDEKYTQTLSIATEMRAMLNQATSAVEGVSAIFCPTDTDGTYTLQCVVANGVATYSWIRS